MSWIGKQIEWLKSFFQEPNIEGKASMKRLLMFVVTISYLHSYVKVTLAEQKLVDITDNWMFFLAGIIGLGILDKYVDYKKGKDNGQL